MPSHFSTIGFEVSSLKDFRSLAESVADRSETIEVAAGRYLKWAPPSGEQLWLQVDRDNDLVGMHPHFSGKSSVPVGIEARVTRDSDTPLDGAFRAWANPSPEGMDTGDYPFVFDCPDAATYVELSVPTTAVAQIAAFAREVSLYESREAFEASPAFHDLKRAPQSFIPSGLFSPDGEETKPPEAHAIVTGIVVETGERRNSISGRTFWWALIETLGGRFDVVIDPELLLSTRPRPGGVLSGSFWLSGRLASQPRRRAGWSRRARD